MPTIHLERCDKDGFSHQWEAAVRDGPTELFAYRGVTQSAAIKLALIRCNQEGIEVQREQQ